MPTHMRSDGPCKPEQATSKVPIPNAENPMPNAQRTMSKCTHAEYRMQNVKCITAKDHKCKTPHGLWAKSSHSFISSFTDHTILVVVLAAEQLRLCEVGRAKRWLPPSDGQACQRPIVKIAFVVNHSLGCAALHKCCQPETHNSKQTESQILIWLPQ